VPEVAVETRPAEGTPRDAAARPEAQARRGGARALPTWLPPAVVFVLFLLVWQGAVTALGVPAYLLPGPWRIGETALNRWRDLAEATAATFESAVLAFGLAVVVGTLVALAMSQSKLLERSIYPYAIMLQTIPVVAIAPLIVIWLGAGMPAVVCIGFIIAVFPVISNTTVGLTSTDHNLVNLMEMYNATWWQRLIKLRFPAALPYIMAGLRISSGLAVIGVIVGEFIAGIGGLRGGLGYTITNAAGRLDMPYLFAAALTSSLLGIVIFIVINMISDRSLRHWHESSVTFEN
jgi:NitT/TauT family transport system permease protein